jgi:hypothetical protein
MQKWLETWSESRRKEAVEHEIVSAPDFTLLMRRRVYHEILTRIDTVQVQPEEEVEEEEEGEEEESRSTDDEDEDADADEDAFCYLDLDAEALSPVDIDLDEIDDFLNEAEDFD